MVTSYGVSVQNKYSAFIEDEDGIGAIAAPNLVVSSSALKRSDQGKKVSTPSTAPNKQSVLSGKNVNGKQATGQRQPILNHPKQSNGKHSKDSTTSRHESNNNHQKFVNSNPSNPAVHRQSNRHVSHETNATGNKNIKNHTANNHYNSLSDTHRDNDENGPQSGKAARSGNYQQRPYNNRNRSYNNENRRQQTVDGVPSNQSFPTPGTNLEEEKRRRQQKRALDLKHKDPEKREARRQQAASGTEQSKENHEVEAAQVDGTKPPRRNIERFAENGARTGGRNFASARGRGRRLPTGDAPSNPEASSGEVNGQPDGQPYVRGPRNPADRPPRNRNGFGTGSRGGRSFRGAENGRYERDSERSKPIPNFSDKQDFPSLAS